MATLTVANIVEKIDPGDAPLGPLRCPAALEELVKPRSSPRRAASVRMC